MAPLVYELVYVNLRYGTAGSDMVSAATFRFSRLPLRSRSEPLVVSRFNSAAQAKVLASNRKLVVTWLLAEEALLCGSCRVDFLLFPEDLGGQSVDGRCGRSKSPTCM